MREKERGIDIIVPTRNTKGYYSFYFTSFFSKAPFGLKIGFHMQNWISNFNSTRIGNETELLFFCLDNPNK